MSDQVKTPPATIDECAQIAYDTVLRRTDNDSELADIIRRGVHDAYRVGQARAAQDLDAARPAADRGRHTSDALTEVRTVHKRAQSALGRLDHLEQYRGTYYSDDRIDPDTPQIRSALEQVVELLEPWKRTGRPKKAAG